MLYTRRGIVLSITLLTGCALLSVWSSMEILNGRSRALLETEKCARIYTSSRSASVPRIFVYPPVSSGCGTLPSPIAKPLGWERLELFLDRAFEGYEGRVTNPQQADFFFVPHATTAVYHESSYNHSTALCHIKAVLDHVAKFPFAQRSAWIDHIVPWAHDNFQNNVGDKELLPLDFRKNAIFIVNQGDDAAFVPADASLRVQDFDIRTSIITLPPSWDATEEWARQGRVRPLWHERKYLAVFRGSLLENPNYSNGVRQALAEQFQLVRQNDIIFENHAETYADEMRESKFCLFIKGWTVWSERLGTIINAGCIPVIISDHYALPFWQNLDWSTFSLRMSQRDAIIPGALRAYLHNVSQSRALELEAELIRIRPTLLYNLPPQRGDIFTRILDELSQRLPAIRPVSGVTSFGQ